ncbi:VWA domain-containing protein [Brevibacillus nitrificans]|uniref:VWA domain-containing protein n=1 Tax=Brevibacillus nitrificans TaxID=651560 RepID=A0A3M8DL75_9BACL|nr:VWA domain-containing protein [Brevibacillus nitrificans]
MLVVDSTASMGTMDMNNNTATRYQVAEEAIHEFLNVIFSAEYASIEKHLALVTFGNGARVHVTKADGQGKFSGLVNPSPSTISAGGMGVVEDFYIGANSYDPTQAQTALLNFQSVSNKTEFFYQDEASVLQMVDNISRYSNTNVQSGLLLATDLLNGVPQNAHKLIILITDGESAASSNFYAYYNQANIPTRINSATFVQENSLLFAVYNGIFAQVTDADLIQEGIDPSNYDPATFTALQSVRLKLRAFSRSNEFFEDATSSLVINPFAGEWHNFDGRNADNITRVPSNPNFLDPIALNGYYWSNGLIGFTANYFYYEKSPFFAKSGGIWQFSQSPTGIPLQPVYVDPFYSQSIIGQSLNTVTFDNSDTELMIFATDQKIPQTRLIDYYEQTSRNIYASNEAKKFMIDAAETARANGIVIDSIGIGSAILLPEYLDKVASSGIAFIVPRDINDAQNALRDQMLEFTREVYTLTEDIVITDMIPRRPTPSLPINDGTFQLSLASIQVAFVHTPDSPIVFQPAEGLVTVNVEEDRYIVSFSVGDIWSPEDAAQQENRYYKAILSLRITANNGVESSNAVGIPDIPTNLDAFVSWIEAETERFLPYPPVYVYVPESCTTTPVPTPAPNNLQPECIHVPKIYDWVFLTNQYRNNVSIPENCQELVNEAVSSGIPISISCQETEELPLCRVIGIRRETILVNGTAIRIGVVQFLFSSNLEVTIIGEDAFRCVFDSTVQIEHEIVLCLPEPLDEHNIFCQILALECRPIGNVLLGGMVPLEVLLCAEIQVEVSVHLEVLANFCSPRSNSLPVPSPTPFFACLPSLSSFR